MRALLVIDMQQGSFTEQTPRYEAAAVVRRINHIAQLLRDKGGRVIFIQHDGTRFGNFIPGTISWKLLDDLQMEPGDHYVAKTANDCFYRSGLAALLEAEKVSELLIAGCATDFCVDTTVKSALAKDLTVTVLADAHTTADRPGMAAQQVIAHYNWVWQGMIPTEGNLRVLSCEAFEQELL